VHLVEELWAEVDALPPTVYPPGVLPVPEHIRGTAFFAAGAGLVVGDPGDQLPPFPYGGVMFVGNNPDAEASYIKRLHSGVPHGDRARPMKTWKNLYLLLDGAGVDPTSCFFTNVFVGLVRGKNPLAGVSTPAGSTYRKWCRDFLTRQITVMKPRAIVALGSAALDHFGSDPAEDGMITVAGHEARFACLAHPSMYPANLSKRGGWPGEVARLRSTVEW